MFLPAADRVWICASNRIAEGAYLKAAWIRIGDRLPVRDDPGPDLGQDETTGNT